MIKILIFTLAVFTQNIMVSQENKLMLTIEVVGLKSNHGNVLIQLTDDKENVVEQQKKRVINKSCTFIFSNTVSGTYAIRVFHDENRNNELDNNWLGIPTEDYAFSNNAKAMFGIPSLKDRLFTVKSDKKITIKMN